jgi:hypothetical protein
VPDEPALSVTAPALDRTLNEIQARFATIVHSTNSANKALCKEGFRLVTDARRSTASVFRVIESEIAWLDRPFGMHTYNAGGIHEGDCAACAQRERLRTALREARGETAVLA